MQKILNFIDGEYREPLSGQWLDNYQPSTGKVYSQVANSGKDDVGLAYESAKKAFASWSKTTPQERADMLRAIANEIEKNLDSLAESESKDQGKPMWLARKVDIPRAVYNFRFFADAVLQREEKAFPMGDTALNYTVRRPVGVCGLISPWNLPLYLLTWKIAPAIAYGNTCVAKPSEMTPMTAFMLGEILNKAGLPKGVVNIVQGAGKTCGQAITEHDKIPLVSFTGGTATAESIIKASAKNFKKLSLELGGKNPALVFADCNWERTVSELVRASFTNQGEICLCSSRIYVEKPVYDKFVSDFVAAAKKLQVGDPTKDSSNLGALVSKAHQQKVLGYIEKARELGATVHCGGTGSKDGGYYVEPTVLTGLEQACPVIQEEIFGPVVAILPFENADEAITLANDSQYGLSATVWTGNLNTAHRVAHEIDAGTVWVNTWMMRDLRVPFGGMKASGLGREGAQDSYEFFTEVKNVCLAFD